MPPRFLLMAVLLLPSLGGVMAYAPSPGDASTLMPTILDRLSPQETTSTCTGSSRIVTPMLPSDVKEYVATVRYEGCAPTRVSVAVTMRDGTTREVDTDGTLLLPKHNTDPQPRTQGPAPQGSCDDSNPGLIEGDIYMSTNTGEERLVGAMWFLWDCSTVYGTSVEHSCTATGSWVCDASYGYFNGSPNGAAILGTARGDFHSTWWPHDHHQDYLDFYVEATGGRYSWLGECSQYGDLPWNRDVSCGFRNYG